MDVVGLFSLGATTDATDYLRNFNLLEAKVNPARYSYRVYIMQYTSKYIR